MAFNISENIVTNISSNLVDELTGPPPSIGFLLLEDSSFLLLEDGSKIILEN